MEAIVAQSATTVIEMPRNASPLPTDSMVTVRLSDAQIHPVSNDSVRNSRRRRSSSANSHSSSISTRSSTRSSTPSNTTVDWEELEKTEQQEPRDQATDEVCLRSPTNCVTSTNADSPPPSSWLAWNRRMLHWWETPNLALFLLPGLKAALALPPSNI